MSGSAAWIKASINGSGNRGRLAAEADQLCDAVGGADRGDVVLAQVKPDEKIAGEQGFDLVSPLAAIAVALFDFGQIDLECLAAQIFRSTHFLPGFGIDGVPVLHVGIRMGAEASLIER